MADAWLESMIDEIRVKEAELLNLKRAANTFYRAKELPAPFPDTDQPDTSAAGLPMKFRPDEFYGKGFATAVRTFMERRGQGVGAVSADDILRALEQGGFDFDALGWKDENRARTVSMSLAKNTAIFHRLPNGLFGLKEWYPEAIERKKGKKSEKDENGEKDEAAGG